MSNKRQKKTWSSYEDRIFVDHCLKQLPELYNRKKGSGKMIGKLKEVVRYMTAHGKPITVTDVRHKLHNLYLKYKKYQAAQDEPYSELRPWDIYDKVGRLVAAKRANATKRSKVGDVHWDEQSLCDEALPMRDVTLMSETGSLEQSYLNEPHLDIKAEPASLEEGTVKPPPVQPIISSDIKVETIISRDPSAPFDDCSSLRDCSPVESSTQRFKRRNKLKRGRRKKLMWTPKEERMFVDLWQIKLAELCPAPKKGVFTEMAAQLTRMGKTVSGADVRSKLSTLQMKYKKYKEAMALPNCQLRRWGLYDRVGALISAKRIMIENNVRLGVQTEIDASSLDDFPCIEPAQPTSLSEDMKQAPLEETELLADTVFPPVPPSLAEHLSTPPLFVAQPTPAVEFIQSTDEPTVATSTGTMHADTMQWSTSATPFVTIPPPFESIPPPFESIPPPDGYLVSFVETEEPSIDQTPICSTETVTATPPPRTTHAQPATTMEFCANLLQKLEEAMARNASMNEERCRADREMLQIMREMREDSKRLTDGFLQFLAKKD